MALTHVLRNVRNSAFVQLIPSHIHSWEIVDDYLDTLNNKPGEMCTGTRSESVGRV
jgi:hypothetical protein